jgi:hypothetical protein
LTLHPAQKFHGFRDIERLAAREVRLVRMGRAPRVLLGYFELFLDYVDEHFRFY